ncbi:hypothetical protein WN51_14067 [Melipona quadrifasciata]|uniref:Uncharacterized protein n=1 Tax=Melipona quadrifasciata TaxID=166423 RepID=A0A0N0BFX9_9HYME|nr:hypothetical protein WN51_14067 [Melipona quadrifasciata]
MKETFLSFIELHSHFSLSNKKNDWKMIEGAAAKSENWRIEWQRWVPGVLLPFCGKPESSSRSSYVGSCTTIGNRSKIIGRQSAEGVGFGSAVGMKNGMRESFEVHEEEVSLWECLYISPLCLCLFVFFNTSYE